MGIGIRRGRLLLKILNGLLNGYLQKVVNDMQIE